MVEPQKPFACSVAECGMTFTNEDHLHVHSKKHDMVLQLGLEQKAAFVADQTPTPTRFIRNCEEVGLFQDLQHVAENPFDEGFKKAMETKQGILCLENVIAGSDDVLHTPQMVFALDSGDSALFSTGQRLISISRSSSDESGVVKAGGTTISRLSNEIKISRTVSRDVIDKITAEDDTVVKNTDTADKSSVNETIYTKNVIQTVIKDGTKTIVETKDVLLTDMNKLQVPEKQQIMSQKSLDYVVDSLTSEVNNENDNIKDKNPESNVQNTERALVYVNEDMNKIYCKLDPPSVQIMKIVPNMTSKLTPKPPKLKRTITDFNKLPKLEPKPEIQYDSQDIEVMIKLPNGKKMRMRAVDDEKKPDYKQIIKNKLINKQNTRISTIENQKSHEDVEIITVRKKMAGVVNKTLNTPSSASNRQVQSKTVNVSDKIEKPVTNKTSAPVIITSAGHMIIQGTVPSVHTKSVSIINNEKINQGTKIRKPNQIEHSSDSKLVSKDNIDERVKTVQTARNNKVVDIEIDGNEVQQKGIKSGNTKRSKIELEYRSAASKRYRDRLKQQMANQQLEIQALREANQRLMSEKAALKILITEHMKKCPNAEELRITQAKIQKNAGL